MENYTIQTPGGFREEIKAVSTVAAKRKATIYANKVEPEAYSVTEENGRTHTRRRWDGPNAWGWKEWQTE